MVQKIVPELTEAELVTTVTPILQEYLEHGDTNEVAVSCVPWNDLFTEPSVSLSLRNTRCSCKICLSSSFSSL